MGYTHYYRYNPNHPAFQSAWPQMVADASLIVTQVQAAGITILGFDNIPPVTPTGIALAGDYNNELHAEPLIISPTTATLRPWLYDENGTVRTFCKTERFPYDSAVAAILLRCHTLAPTTFALTSDGTWETDWLKNTTYPPTSLSPRTLLSTLFAATPTESPFTNLH